MCHFSDFHKFPQFHGSSGQSLKNPQKFQGLLAPSRCYTTTDYKKTFSFNTYHEGCKAELTYLAWLHTKVVYLPKDSHPSRY